MRVLVTGAGGSIGIDVCRSLADAPGVELVGAEASPWGARLARRFCSQVVLLPRPDRDGPEAFCQALARQIEALGVDFVWINPDPELEAVARCGWQPPCAHPLPGPEVLRACLDKETTGRRLQPSGLAPETLALEVELPPGAGVAAGEDSPPANVCLVAQTLLPQLEEAFGRLDLPLWVRPGSGAGGIGSLRVDQPQEAAFWVALWSVRRGVRRWVVQEYLPGGNFNCTLLYAAGRLVAWAAMQRLGYFLAETAPSGITGQVKLCRTVQQPDLLAAARQAAELLDAQPHGIYSVDLRQDVQGRPRVTEINPRLAGRPWLYTRAGCNLPQLALRVLQGTEPEDARPCCPRPGWTLYRQLDCHPLIVPPGETADEYAHPRAGNTTSA